MNGLDDDVPYTDTPRAYEVSLFLCGAAMRVLSEHWLAHPEHTRELYAWYLRKVAFLNSDDAEAAQIVEVLLQRRQRAAVGVVTHHEFLCPPATPTRVADEVDFKSALKATFRLADAENEEGDAGHVSGSAISVNGSAVETKLEVPGVVDRSPRLLFDNTRAAWVQQLDVEKRAPSHTVNLPTDEGFALLLQFLSVFSSLEEEDTVTSGDGDKTGDIYAPETLVVSCAAALVELFTSVQAQRGNDPLFQTKDIALPVDHATLDLYLTMDDETRDDAVMCVGSVTRSFHALTCISWACASFQHQAALVAIVNKWVVALTSLMKEPGILHDIMQQCRHASQVANDKVSGRDNVVSPVRERTVMVTTRRGEEDEAVISLTGAHQLLRQVFEGHRDNEEADDGVNDEDLDAADAADSVSAAKNAKKSIDGGLFDSPAAGSARRQRHRRGGAKLSDLFASSRPMHLADNYVARLLALRELTGGGAPAADIPQRAMHNRGTQPILQSIATGTLLYVQLHLSLRALPIAQQCANMALLASHQLHSPSALALAHYTNFVVLMARGRLLSAADSIAIALQLASSPAAVAAAAAASRLTSDGSDPPLNTSSLCYAGVAELLLFFPGAVNPSLRALLTCDSAARGSFRLTLGAAGDDGGGDTDGNAGDDAANRGDVVSAKASGRGHAVVVHTIAQTVRNTLWLAEASALQALAQGSSAPSSPTAAATGNGAPASTSEGLLPLAQPSCWADLAASLSRQTLLTVGSLYGIRAPSQGIDTTALGMMLTAINADARVRPPLPMNGAVTPRRVLLAEATRLTAHRVLAIFDGRAAEAFMARSCPHNTGKREDHCTAALRVASGFLAAVRVHYGPAGLASVGRSIVFAAAVQLAALGALARRGYTAAAYDGLSGIVLRLYRFSGASHAAAAATNVTGNPFDDSVGVDGFRCNSSAGVRAAADAEEARVLQFLRAAAAAASAAAEGGASVGGGRDEASSVGAARAATAAAAAASTEMYWPPDHLLLLATVHARRAELALQLGYVDAIDSSEAALKAVSAHCSYVHGVLVSRYIGLLSRQARRNYSGLATAADALLSSAANIGLTVLKVAVIARKVSALTATGRWSSALAALDAAVSCINEEYEAWFAITRLNVGYEALLQLMRQSSIPSAPAAYPVGAESNSRSAVSAVVDNYVREGIERLAALGLLNPVSASTPCMKAALRDALAARATVARLTVSHGTSQDQANSLMHDMRTLTAVMARRQRTRRLFTALFDRSLEELCMVMLAGDGDDSLPTLRSA